MGVTMLETEPDASLWETFAHKWRMFNLVREVNGLGAALCEGAYQCCKPLVYAYTKLAWWRSRRRGSSTVSVLGNQLSLHPHDKGVSIELAVYRVHEPCTTRLLTRCLRPGNDRRRHGCNIGYYALLEAQQVGPTGRVIAIEPEPKNARLFLHNLQLNGYRNVTFHQVAISDHNGTLSLRISEKSNRHSLCPGVLADQRSSSFRPHTGQPDCQRTSRFHRPGAHGPRRPRDRRSSRNGEYNPQL